MRRRILPAHETVLAIVIAALAAAVAARNPAFLSAANLFDLLRSAAVPGLFALGTLVVLVSGGIDVSFTAIGAFALYATVRLLGGGFEGSFLVPLAVAGAIGLGLGLVNAAFIAGLGLPTLIVTLGTSGLFRGFLLFAVGSLLTRDLPEGMVAFSRARIAAVPAPEGGAASLHPAVLILAGAAALTWILLRWTILGRGIHAIGGNPEAAARIGFAVGRIRTLVYALAGGLAGIAGIVHASLIRQANPSDLVGSELDVIAAVVLGGASISGGRGTVAGALLGVLLVTMANNSLILVGIPTAWQKVAIGAAILIGTGIPAVRAARAGRRGAAAAAGGAP
jgi:simple sugar transport system permease protein